GADEAHESRGRRDAERHAEIDLRDPELRFRGREPEIAGQCESPAAADGVAVDGGDRDLLEALERGVDALEEPPELRLARRHRLAPLLGRHAALERRVGAGGEDRRRATAEYVERAKITRLMRRLGVATLEELQRRSVDDPEWYWRGVVEDLGIRFTRPFSRVLDATRGPAWPRWFPDGRLNFADNCL